MSGTELITQRLMESEWINDCPAYKNCFVRESDISHKPYKHKIFELVLYRNINNPLHFVLKEESTVYRNPIPSQSHRRTVCDIYLDRPDGLEELERFLEQRQ